MDHAGDQKTNADSASIQGMVARNGLLIAREFESVLKQNHLDSMARLFADDVGERLDKPGLATWRQRRRLFLNDNGRPISLYMKRFDHPPPVARRVVRQAANGAKSLAGVEYHWIVQLRQHGIACPAVVAFGEEFQSGEFRSVLVTLGVAGQSLEKSMPSWFALRPDRRRAVLLASARFVVRLHGHGFVHRDLYLSHLFFDPEKTVDEALCLIDLQRVLRPRRMRRWVIKDLASLNFSSPSLQISLTDRLRWLLAYLGIARLNTEAKRLAYRVIGKTATIARKEMRRRRQEG